MREDGTGGVDAGHDDGGPGPSSEIGIGNRLNPEQRGDHDIMPTGPQHLRGPLRLRFGTSYQESHGLNCREKISTGTLAQLATGIGAERRGGGDAAGPARGECRRAVRPDDETIKL